MAAEFLINVRSKWDSSSVRAYEAEVKKAIANIKAAAASAARAGAGAGASAPTAEARRQVLGNQARMEANLSTLRKETKAGTSGIDLSQYSAIAKDQRAGMRLAAQAAGVDLLVGKERVKAANEVLREAKKSGAAAANATKAAAQETARDRARARANQTRTGASSDEAEEKRLRADERKARADKNRQDRENAKQARHDEQERARIRLGLPEFDPNLTARERQRELAPHLTRERIAAGTPQAKRGAEEGRVQWGRDVLANQDGMLDEVKESTRLLARINAIRRRIRESEAQQARLSREAVILSAKELVSRASFKGNVAEEVGQHPVAVEALAKARIQARTLAEQIGRSAESQADEARRGGNVVALANQQKKIEGAVLKKTVAAEEDARVWETIAGDSRAQSAFSQQQRAKAAARAGGAEKLADLEDRARNRRDVSPDLTALKTEHTRQVKAEAKISAADEKRAAAAQKAAVLAAEQAAKASRPASLYQRFEALVGRGNQPASERPTLGQTLGAGVLSAARFGAGAAVLYGGINTIKQMVTEASELERVFGLVESQFRATGKAAQFQGFRDQIIEISKATGEMATKVAFVGFQFQGAFGNGPGGAAYALEQTRAAIEIAKVTGLDLNELVDSLTSSSISFGVSISAVGDKALGIQERFGVQAKETLQFFGDLATVAADAGLNLDQLGAIAGAVQQATGKSGSSLAEGLGRIIPGIQEASIELVRFYQATPALASKVPDIAAAAGQGQTGAVLERLIRDYHLLDASQKKQIITLLGGRREAQILIPILENSAKVVEELDGQLAGLDDRYNDSGKSAKYFANLQRTLSQQLSQLAREFEALGQKLFEAGLGDLLKDIVTGAGSLLQILLLVAKAMAAFNTATGGAALKVAELIVAWKVLAALGAKVNIGKLLYGAVTPALGPTGAPVRVGGILRNYGASFLGARVAAGRAAAVGAGASGFAGAPLTAGAAALGINPITAGLVVGAVGFSVYQQRTAKLEASATAFKKSLGGVDTKELQRLRDSRERKVDFWSKLWIRLPGGPTKTPEEILDDEIQHRDDAGLIRQFEAANKAGLVQGDPKKIASAIAEAKKGNQSALEAIGLILIDLKDNQGTALNSAIADFDKAAGTDATVAKVNDGTFQQSVEAAEQAYEAGLISSSDYLKVLDSAQAAYQVALGKAGRLTDDQAKQLAGILKKSAAFQSGKARELDDYNISIVELNGGDKNAATVSTLTKRLQDPNFTDASERLKAAKDIIAAQNDLTAQRVAAADSVEEQLAIMEAGTTIPDVARVAILQNGIVAVGTQWQAFLQVVTGSMQGSIDLGRRIAQLSIDMNISVKEATKKILNDMLTVARGMVTRFQQPGMPESSLSHWEDEVFNLTNQLADVDKQPDVKVPGKTSKPDSNALKAKKADAAKEAHKRAEETARARLAYRKAAAEGDPVAQADIAIEEAKYSESIATTAAEHLNAATQLLEANRAKLVAQASVADAYLDLDTALAAAAGDTVKVAKIELDGARRRLDEAKKRGDVVGAIAAEADVVAKQAGLADAELQSKTDEADFLHEMEQISDAQYIAIYKSILNTIPPEQIQKRRQFMLKLHELEKGVADDLNFNIPTEIKLPTLYEVRRLRQTEATSSPYGVGSSYQDNRQIMVQYNVLTAQDNQAALDDLLAVTSGQPRVGASPKGY